MLEPSATRHHSTKEVHTTGPLPQKHPEYRTAAEDYGDSAIVSPYPPWCWGLFRPANTVKLCSFVVL